VRDADHDALIAYEEAEERRQAIIAAWDEEGRPLISVGHAGQPVAHPLVKIICSHMRM
jgi:hypothetical protein